jgi:hypothetical protein
MEVASSFLVNLRPLHELILFFIFSLIVKDTTKKIIHIFIKVFFF